MHGLFITGTDTDAGKSVVVAALLRAALQQGVATCAIKPVQTGVFDPATQGDEALYRDATAGMACATECACTLQSFHMPASPHCAAAAESRTVDVEYLLHNIQTRSARTSVLLEGAGGPMVPLTPDVLTLDFMVRLALPVLLVVGNRLGALNHALMALRVLRDAGLHVAAAVFTHPQPPNGNKTTNCLLRDNIATFCCMAGADIQVVELAHQADLHTADATLRKAAWDALARPLTALVPLLVPRDTDNTALLDADRRHLWHPYTSATAPLPVYEAVAAQGTHIRLADGRELVDGMSSWWCAVHGYGHPRLLAALRQQAGRMPHVMFGGLTHKPAVQLAEQLLPLLPGHFEHLFLADSGSVAIEAALKMAVQYWQARNEPQRTRMLTPRGGYHGDTQGAMGVCDPINGMHTLFKGVLHEQLFVERPACRFDQPFNPDSLAPVEAALCQHHASLAGVVLEPIVQGAGGMWLYHPDYLRHMRRLCDQYGLLLIVDEIATGFGRTGKLFASEWAGIAPDILCLGKALTGGMMTLAAVAATADVAAGVSAKGGVFMHGPTFMGNPLACSVALESTRLLLDSPWQARVARIEAELRQGLEPCRAHPAVADVRVLGAIGIVEMHAPIDMARLQTLFVDCGVWIRPFGRLIYLMPPFICSTADMASLTTAVRRAVQASAG